MDFAQSVAYIESTKRFGSKPGLAVMSRMLEKMENPQKKYKAVHIAGTNGKGSTSALVANVLQKSGYQVGLFTSPPIFSELERIRINGENITEQAFAEICTDVRALAEELEQEGLRYPTEFEIYTLIAFAYFAQQNVDIAVFEVGMGGRLDSTNVCDSAVSVITAIGYDHMQWLGNSLEEIAGEKAGIIRESVPVVVYPQQELAVSDVLKKTAEEKHAPLVDASLVHITVKKCDLYGSTFDFDDGKVCLSDLAIALAGEHQIKNSVTAVDALLTLRNLGYTIPNESIKEGLRSTVWHGRFEVIRREPLVIADGGHNQQCMSALAACVEKFLGEYERILVFSMFADKDCLSAISAVEGLFGCVIVTEMQHKRRAKAEELAKYFHGEVNVIKDPAEAVEYAESLAENLKLQGKKAAIVISGSLNLLEELAQRNGKGE